MTWPPAKAFMRGGPCDGGYVKPKHGKLYEVIYTKNQAREDGEVLITLAANTQHRFKYVLDAEIYKFKGRVFHG